MPLTPEEYQTLTKTLKPLLAAAAEVSLRVRQMVRTLAEMEKETEGQPKAKRQIGKC